MNYYDYKGRNIQTFAQNHLGGIDRTDYQYRFNNEVLIMRMEHQGINEIYNYDYDHLGRKTAFKHTLNGTLKNVAKYEYDEIGRLKTKKLSPTNDIGTQASGDWNNTNVWLNGSVPSVNDHVFINETHTITIPNGQAGSAGSLFLGGILNNYGRLDLGKLPSSFGEGTLQMVDYAYHIRGLRGINLDDSGNLTNKLFSMRLGYEDAGFFDGNIGKQEWKSSLDNLSRSFTYSYDGSSRIISGLYVGNGTENYSLNSVNYDLNGNITNLSRNGWKSNNTFGLIDNLNYTYQRNSNKIQKIDDASNEVASFKDVAGNDYTYYPDGSLKSDANKGITLIEYNYLKKQSKITFSSGKVINYQYDANGKKLKETIGSQVTDYVGNTIYKNASLYQISHDEGRIINGIYEYNITDHLGNLRVAFKDSLGIAKIVQSNAYGVFGNELRGLSFESNPATKNNFKFLGREDIPEIGLVDLINRQYDPVIGRFTSIDPVTTGQEHLSLYQYAWNNPVLRSDPNGLYPDGECCEDLPTARSTSDATSIARGTPVSLNMPRGQATPAFGLTVSVGKQVALEVGKFGVEANFGSKEVLNVTEMGSYSSSNTSVTTKGFAVSYGGGEIGAEKKVTTTQEAGALSTPIKGVTFKTSATITTENTSSMGAGVSPVVANLEGTKTTTSYVSPHGFTTAPTVTGRNTTATVGASAMPKKGWTSFSVGFGVKVEVKVDLKQAWENVKKYGF